MALVCSSAGGYLFGVDLETVDDMFAWKVSGQGESYWRIFKDIIFKQFIVSLFQIPSV